MPAAPPAGSRRRRTSCFPCCAGSRIRRKTHRSMLSEQVKRRRASSIDEVVDIMTEIERQLSPTDGVWWFNRLYLRVTLSVRDAVTTTTFQDPAFLERLDVVFANQYFDAVAAGDTEPRTAPSAWRPAVRVPPSARHSVDPVRPGRHERAHQPRSTGRDCCHICR